MARPETVRQPPSNRNKKGTLRITGNGDAYLTDLSGMLAAIENAYNSALFFQKIIVDYIDRGSPPGLYELLGYIERFEGKTNKYILRDERIFLKSVKLSSPGFWEFVGTLNIIETIRKFLNDRHARKKDKLYRDVSESEKLALENQNLTLSNQKLTLENQRIALENQIIKDGIIGKRLEIAKEMGVDVKQFEPLFVQWIHKPFEQMGQYQDKNLIQTAKIKKLGTHKREMIAR